MRSCPDLLGRPAAILLGCVAALSGAVSADYGNEPSLLAAGGGTSAAGSYRQFAATIGSIASSETTAGTITNRAGGAGQLNERDAALVALAAAAASISEAAGSLSVGLVRQGDDTGTVTVPFTISGTAAGTAVGPLSGTATFAHGQTTAQVTLTLRNDGRAGGNQTVTLALGRPTGAAAAGTPSQMVITLVDAGAAADPTTAPHRPRITSEPERWVVAGARWSYALTVDVRAIDPGPEAGYGPTLRFQIEGAPAGSTVTAIDATSALVVWPTAAGTGHQRFAVRVDDAASGTSDRQEILLYVTPVPGGAN